MTHRPSSNRQSDPREVSLGQAPRADRDFTLQLRDYRLTTAEILYHMPDHPGLLQTYVWQDYDLAPHFPVLRKFLNFWSHSLDGKLHSISVTSNALLRAPGWRQVNDFLTLH
ncbi:usg protein [Dongia soli]|uniref:Usg family protein n=1 Tax=Dongia soli TaxID=600628 RepID=A0ABU5E4H1_9PROT|nr:Usg family protein [Dongia soli]MDY0881215.1 Usg family protein [Dongia soli]